jgi:hypothetical protein
MSLADACIVRMTEIYERHHSPTYDPVRRSTYRPTEQLSCVPGVHTRLHVDGRLPAS